MLMISFRVLLQH